MVLTQEERESLAIAIVYRFLQEPAALQSHLKNELNYDFPPVCHDRANFRGAVEDLVIWFDEPEFILDFLRLVRNLCPAFSIKPIYDRVIWFPNVLDARIKSKTEISLDNFEHPFDSMILWNERLPVVIRQICRIKRGDGEHGTGFLVGPDLVLTNYHVIYSRSKENAEEHFCDPSRVVCEFDFGKNDQPATKICLHQDWLPYWGKKTRMTEDGFPGDPGPKPDELDYAMIRLDSPIGLDRGWIEFPSKSTLATPLFVDRMGLIIVQHPMGAPNSHDYQPHSIERRAGFWTIWNGLRLRHRTNTRGGSSGSPCFDQNWRLVALHHAGYDGLSLDPANKRFAYGKSRLFRYNQAIPIDKIRDHLESKWKWTQPKIAEATLVNSISVPDSPASLEPPQAMIDNVRNDLRLDLIDKLEGLSKPNLNKFISAYYSANYRPAANHDTNETVTHLTKWIESNDGPGLVRLTRDFYEFLSQEEPANSLPAVNSPTAGTSATSPLTSGNLPSMNESEIQELMDELEQMPTSYLKAFINRYYGRRYKPFNGENHEIVERFFNFAEGMGNVSHTEIRDNLKAYKARFVGGGKPASHPNPTAPPPRGASPHPEDDDLSDWSDEDWERLKTVISRLSLDSESTRTLFLMLIVGDKTRDRPWSEFIRNPSVSEFGELFVHQIKRQQSRVLLKKLLEATLRRGPNPTDTKWLAKKIDTI